jgi:hypothetical protein
MFIFVTIGPEASGHKRQEEVVRFLDRTGYVGNGLHLMTPNGEKLDKETSWWSVHARWIQKPLKDRQKLDDLGKWDPAYPPEPPRNGLILKVYRRTLQSKRMGEWSSLSKIVSKEGGTHDPEPQRDHVWFKEDEWKPLVKTSPREGDIWPVPTEITDRLCRFHLIDATTGITEQWYWLPDSVKSQELKVTVERVSPTTISMRLDGSAQYGPAYRGPEGPKGEVITYKVRGYLIYDVKKGKFTRFDVTAVAMDGHYDIHKKVRQPLGVAFELTPAEKPADRIPPFFYFEKRYFTPVK